MKEYLQRAYQQENINKNRNDDPGIIAQRIEPYVPLDMDIINKKEIKLPFSLEEIEQILSKEEKVKILFQGNAGSGKSTVFDELLHMYSNGKILQDFLLFRINFRDLSSQEWQNYYARFYGQEYLPHFINFSIKKMKLNGPVQFLSDEGRDYYEDIKEALKTKNAIVIADDFSSATIEFKRELLNLKKVMASSQPSSLNSITKNYFSHIVNVNGFDSKGLNIYIQQFFLNLENLLKEEVKKFFSSNIKEEYFTNNDDLQIGGTYLYLKDIITRELTEEEALREVERICHSKMAMVLDLVKRNKAIKEVALTPMNTSILCIVLSDSKTDKFSDSFTLDELYGELVLWIGKRFIIVEKKNLNPSDEEIQAKIVNVMQKIAYMKFVEKTELSGANIKQVLSNHDLNLEDISKLGLLKEVGKISQAVRKNSHRRVHNDKSVNDNPDNKVYDFIHQSVLEYLAACEFRDLLSLPKENKEAREASEFIAAHKHEFKYLMFLKFLAGILSTGDNELAIQRFWEAVVCNVNNILKIGIEADIKLLPHLLSQAYVLEEDEKLVPDSRIPNLEAIITMLDHVIIKDLFTYGKVIAESGYLSVEIYQYFINILQQINPATMARSRTDSIDLKGSAESLEMLEIENLSLKFLHEKEKSSPYNRYKSMDNNDALVKLVMQIFSSLLCKLDNQEVFNYLLDKLNINQPWRIKEAAIESIVKIIKYQHIDMDSDLIKRFEALLSVNQESDEDVIDQLSEHKLTRAVEYAKTAIQCLKDLKLFESYFIEINQLYDVDKLKTNIPLMVEVLNRKYINLNNHFVKKFEIILEDNKNVDELKTIVEQALNNLSYIEDSKLLKHSDSHPVFLEDIELNEREKEVYLRAPLSQLITQLRKNDHNSDKIIKFLTESFFPQWEEEGFKRIEQILDLFSVVADDIDDIKPQYMQLYDTVKTVLQSEIDKMGDEHFQWFVKNQGKLDRVTSKVMSWLFEKAISDNILTKIESDFIILCVKNYGFSISIKAPQSRIENGKIIYINVIIYNGREYSLEGEENRIIVEKIIEEVGKSASSSIDSVLGIINEERLDSQEYIAANQNNELKFENTGSGMKIAAKDIQESFSIITGRSITYNQVEISFLYLSDHNYNRPTDVFILIESREPSFGYHNFNKIYIDNHGKIKIEVFGTYPEKNMPDAIKTQILGDMKYTEESRTRYYSTSYKKISLDATLLVKQALQYKLETNSLPTIGSPSKMASIKRSWKLYTVDNNQEEKNAFENEDNQDIKIITVEYKAELLFSMLTKHVPTPGLIGIWQEDLKKMVQHNRKIIGYSDIDFVRQDSANVIQRENQMRLQNLEEFKRTVDIELLTDIIAEGKRTKDAQLEMEVIEQDAYQFSLYKTIVITLNSVFIAVQGIHSEMLKSDSDGVYALTGNLLQDVSKHVPMLGIAVDFIGKIFNAIDDEVQDTRIENFVKFELTSEAMSRTTDKLAREIIRKIIIKRDFKDFKEDIFSEISDEGKKAYNIVKKGPAAAIVKLCFMLKNTLSMPKDDGNEEEKQGQKHGEIISKIIIEAIFAGKFNKHYLTSNKGKVKDIMDYLLKELGIKKLKIHSDQEKHDQELKEDNDEEKDNNEEKAEILVSSNSNKVDTPQNRESKDSVGHKNCIVMSVFQDELSPFARFLYNTSKIAQNSCKEKNEITALLKKAVKIYDEVVEDSNFKAMLEKIDLFFGKNAYSQMLDLLLNDEEVREEIQNQIEEQGINEVIGIFFDDIIKKFFDAIDHNDINEINRLLSIDPSLVNAKNKDGNSACFYAKIFAHTEIVKLFSEQGAYAHEYERSELEALLEDIRFDIDNSIPSQGFLTKELSASEKEFLEAIDLNDINRIIELASVDSSLVHTENGINAVTWAFALGHNEIGEYLLSQGAQLNQTEQNTLPQDLVYFSDNLSLVHGDLIQYEKTDLLEDISNFEQSNGYLYGVLTMLLVFLNDQHSY